MRYVVGAILALILCSPALSAGIFDFPPAGGSQYPSTYPLTGNETIPADTGLPEGLNPATEVITTNQLAKYITGTYTTFDLVRDFGAKCNGVTDDAIAIQNWLNSATSGVFLTAPGGTCNTSTTLTLGAVGNYTIAGAGQYTTTINYVGVGTTSDILTINAPNVAQVKGITIRDLRIKSTTVMTAGYALRANGVFNLVVANVALDGVNDANGNLCGGLWLNAVSNVEVSKPNFFSKQNCGDGILANAGTLATGAAEVRISSGAIGGTVNNTTSVTSGFINGVHMAGGIGGVRCDNTDINKNQVGWLVDDVIRAAGNRDFSIGSTCALDANQNAGLKLNDALSNGGYANLAGWEASTKQGPGIEVDAWANGRVVLGSETIWNNCGDGVLTNDATAAITIGYHTEINKNGVNQGTGCVTWQGGVGSGHGYGVYSSVATTNVWLGGYFADNVAGDINANVIGRWDFHTGLGQAGHFNLYNSGVLQWEIGRDTDDAFKIWDVQTPGVAFIVSPGGNLIIGETTSSVTLLKGAGRTSGYSIAGLPTCNSTVIGMFTYVTNAQTTPPYLGAVSTTGAVVAPVFCNGVGWVYH